MKSNNFLRVIIFCFAVFLTTEAFAAPLTRQEASLWAEDKGNRLLAAFEEDNLAVKYEELDNLFLSYVDLDYVAQFVVGKYWKVMTTNEKTEYRQLFRRYALGMYKGFPLKFNYPIKFQIVKTVVNGDNADVTAQIHFEGAPQDEALQNLLLSFKLHKGTDGLKIRDLKLAESSLILSYRNKFYQMIAADDGEISWFLEDFRLQIESLERTNQLRLEGKYPYNA